MTNYISNYISGDNMNNKWKVLLRKICKITIFIILGLMLFKIVVSWGDIIEL